ncbi:type II toxin-antitoxin system VapC family toxin, partial [Candidatus Entotheonella palauensis]|uniref:type II toxin-antitoxin system VapC family toxin n=1 Tax=Candidatus Entotheonella palauensis TaxID=93172 RepID=UPI000B7EDE67
MADDDYAMTNYLLDTNHLSPLVTPGHALRQRVMLQLRQGDSFAFAIPVLAELIYGIGIIRRAEQNLTEWRRLRPYFICYIPDEEDAETAAQLQISLRRRGWQLSTVDAFIAISNSRNPFNPRIHRAFPL